MRPILPLPPPSFADAARLLAVAVALVVGLWAVPLARADATPARDDLAGLTDAEARQVRALAETHGVRLVVGRTAAQEGRFRVTPLDPALAGRGVALAASLLAAYPPGLLDEALDEIRLVGATTTDDGTWSAVARCDERRMLVSLDARRLDAGVLRAMHHEVGHLLHCLVDLDASRWKALNGEPYAPSLRAWRSRKGATAGNPAFATRYARLSLHEDVAETFALAITSPQAVRARDPHGLHLARKVALLEATLAARWPGFRFADLARRAGDGVTAGE